MTCGSAPRAPAAGIPAARRVLIPSAVATALARRPPGPVSLAGMLDGRSGAPAFRLLVAAIFPDDAATILGAGHPRFGRAGARVAAFLARIEAEHFPVHEFDEGWYDEDGDAYDALLRGIAFVRMGWNYEQLHELDIRLGYRLLLALCEHPYAMADDAHVPLLESIAPLVPAALLMQIPCGGIHPTTLRERLDGGGFASAADFGEWVWGDTGTAFLDFDDEVEIHDDDWTPENVALLTAQWRRADAILTRIEDLATWLESDPPAHFAELLRAALTPAEGLDASGGGAIAGPGGTGSGETDGHTDRCTAVDEPQGGASDAGSITDEAESDDQQAGEGGRAARPRAAGQPLPARRAA